MDVLQQIKLTTEFEKYVRKDFYHTLMVGLISCIIPILFGYSNNWENKLEIVILFIIIAILFGSLLIYEKLKPYYIIEATKIETNKVPYARIKGSFDFYMSAIELRNVYECKRNSCNNIAAKNVPLTYKVNSDVYDIANKTTNTSIYILLSATKNFIGFYYDKKFYSN